MDLRKSSANARVLNGVVGRDSLSSTGSDVSITDLQYEFFYSISEYGDDDRILYDFDAFPTKKDIDIDSEGQGLLKADRKVSTHSKTSVVSFSGTVKSKEYTDRLTGNDVRKLSKQRESDIHESSPCEYYQRHSATDNSKSKGRPTLRRTQSASSRGSYRSSCRSQSLSRCNSIDTRQSQAGQSDITDKSTTTKLDLQRKKSVSYDPALDKASAFLHSGGKSFSRANTTLNPVRYGLKHLQTNYTEATLDNNNSKIFLDLLKSSHQKNYIRNSAIRNIETRLEIKRKNPHFFTSFYDHNKIPDPLGRNKKKNAARSVAQKMLERKEKIKSTTNELHMGYIPTALTMRQADQAETEEIGETCRYLRCRGPSVRPRINSNRKASRALSVTQP